MSRDGCHTQVFETSGKNKETVSVAGLVVSSGKLSRTHFFRVMRDEEVVADRVKAASMRRHKDRVNEVTKDKVCLFSSACTSSAETGALMEAAELTRTVGG